MRGPIDYAETFTGQIDLGGLASLRIDSSVTDAANSATANFQRMLAACQVFKIIPVWYFLRQFR